MEPESNKMRSNLDVKSPKYEGLEMPSLSDNDRIYLSRSLTIMLFSAFFLTISSAFGGDYQIIGSVTPDYGYGDTTFNYTAQIQLMSENTATYLGSWQMELKIYNGSQEVASTRRPSDPRILKTGEWMYRMTQPFTFGPYNFERDFGIKRAGNASFKFIAYRNGANVSSKRFIGPEVQPPRLLGAPNYNKRPYYVEPFQVTAIFKDKAATTNPKCVLEIHGPQNTSEKEESWTTADVVGKAQGTTYTFTLGDDADLSRFPNGGNFSFFIIYNNALFTDREGPFPLTVRTYSPSIESIEVKNAIDYTNFTIRAYVDDVGMRLVGGSVVNSNATISSFNPRKDPKTTNFTSAEPQIVKRGGKDLLLFEWTRNEIPFTLKDVEISKSSPFEAIVNYRNDNWGYQVSKESRTFIVVPVVPTAKTDYNRTLYVRGNEPATQVITGIVSYPKGKGDLRLELVGKDKLINESSDGVDLGGNRYKYTWSISFNNSSVGNTYQFTLTFSHPSLEGRAYIIPEKYNFTVSSISLNFGDIGVAPLNGKLDQTYTYSAKVTTSLGGIVVLQIYDPCTRKWIDWEESRRIYPGENKLSWVIKPFEQECTDMRTTPPMFSFKAILDRPYESGTFEGPYPIVVMPNIWRYTVNPDSGTSEDRFNYSAVLNFNKPASIELQTYNPLMNQYESKGTRDYNKSGQNQTFSWDLKFPAEFQGKRLSYKLRYQGNDLVVASGPTIQLGGEPRIYYSTVTPKKGSIDTEFTYNVLIGFNKKATLQLQTYNPVSRTYEPNGPLEYYITPGQNQTLIWKVNFSPEYAGQNVSCMIRDVDTRVDLTPVFFGPAINGTNTTPPIPSSVRGNNTTINTTKLSPIYHSPTHVTSPKPGEIPTSQQGNNTSISKPITPQGNNTSTISSADFLRLVTKYHIGSSGGGGGISQEGFNSLLKTALPTISGQITGTSKRNLTEPPSFVDARVTPNSGNWADKFVYEARLQSKNDTSATLGLDVFIPSTKSWKSLDDKDVRSYMYKDHIASIQWNFQGFTPDDADNSSMFRVYYYDQSNARVPLSPSLVGPTNITKQILDLRCRVTPENGTCNNMYNYSILVYNPSKGRIMVALEVLLPGSGEWYPVGEKLLYPSKYGHNNTALITWNIRPFSADDVNKSSAFRVSYEDDRQNNGMKVIEGPELVNHPPKILKSWVEPPNGTTRQSFTYHAVVQDIDGDELQANLFIYDPEQGVVLTRSSQVVRGTDASNPNGTELFWPHKFAESYENKSFEYNVTVIDGVTVKATGNLSGPHMQALPTITVNVLPPESQNNKWWDEYSFKVRVDNPSVQSARFTPAILTSNGWKTLDSKEISKTLGPETLEWKFSGFTASDRNKPIRYTIEYTLPDQYGVFSWTSQGHDEKQIIDVTMSELPAIFNMAYIGLLGCIVYYFNLFKRFSKIGGKKS